MFSVMYLSLNGVLHNGRVAIRTMRIYIYANLKRKPTTHNCRTRARDTYGDSFFTDVFFRLSSAVQQHVHRRAMIILTSSADGHL